MMSTARGSQRLSLAVLPDLGRSGAVSTGVRQGEPEARVREILERAERQAQVVMESARQKAEALLAESQREGLLQGRSEGMREGQARATALARCLEEALARLQAMDAVWGQRGEQAIVELALSLAGRILQRVVHEEPEHVLRMTRDALALMPATGEIRLHVHPDLVQTLEEGLGSVSADAGEGRLLRILGDASIGLGGCVVEAQGSLVDATFSTQLAEARRRLEEAAW